jgi:hypothetical protein
VIEVAARLANTSVHRRCEQCCSRYDASGWPLRYRDAVAAPWVPRKNTSSTLRLDTGLSQDQIDSSLLHLLVEHDSEGGIAIVSLTSVLGIDADQVVDTVKRLQSEGVLERRGGWVVLSAPARLVAELLLPE